MAQSRLFCLAGRLGARGRVALGRHKTVNVTPDQIATGAVVFSDDVGAGVEVFCGDAGGGLLTAPPEGVVFVGAQRHGAVFRLGQAVLGVVDEGQNPVAGHVAVGIVAGRAEGRGAILIEGVGDVIVGGIGGWGPEIGGFGYVLGLLGIFLPSAVL